MKIFRKYALVSLAFLLLTGVVSYWLIPGVRSQTLIPPCDNPLRLPVYIQDIGPGPRGLTAGGETLYIIGCGFTASATGTGSVNVSFFNSAGARTTVSGTFLSDNLIEVMIPTGLRPGDYTVGIWAGGVLTNTIPVQITSGYPTAVIASVQPSSAETGSLITILGTGFTGTIVGAGSVNVSFFDSAGARTTVSGTVISDYEIQVMAPNGLATGNYDVAVWSSGILSNRVPIDITAASTGSGGIGISSGAPPAGTNYIDLGSGTFPDVQFYQGRLWITYQCANCFTVANPNQEIILYSALPNLTDFRAEKRFAMLPAGQGFPRMTVFNNILWLAFRDGDPPGMPPNLYQDVKLWRSDADVIENLGPTGGNDPIALGNGQIAWQLPVAPNFTINVRSLTGGPITEYGDGLPTGISRILPDGSIISIDQDRTAVSWGVRAWFAGSLTVASAFEDLDGAVARFNDDPATQFSLWVGQRSFTPHAASDGAGNYAVAVWGSGITVRVAAFPGPFDSGMAGELPGATEEAIPFPPDFESMESPDVFAQEAPRNIGQLIALIYSWATRVVGVVVFVMIIYGGFLWITAAGDPGQISRAKSKISNAILGAILLFASFLILNTINPELVGNTFTLPGISMPQQ